MIIKFLGYKGKQRIVGTSFISGNEAYIDGIPVDKKSVSLFTGIIDDNGNELFYGDIIHFKGRIGSIEAEITGTIILDKTNLRTAVKSNEFIYGLEDIAYDFVSRKLVGNSYAGLINP